MSIAIEKDYIGDKLELSWYCELAVAQPLTSDYKSKIIALPVESGLRFMTFGARFFRVVQSKFDRWRSLDDGLENPRPHRSHEYGLSPVCMFK
jgi:hypothetical protein